MLCEMCGKDAVATTRIRVEGTVLRLCPDCAKFGEPIDPVPAAHASAPPGRGPPRPLPVQGGTRPVATRRRLEERDLYQDIGEMELATDWAKRVRLAREARTWTPEELGKKLNEKKSIVLKVESGNFRPPDELVRKLEHLLKIRLRAEEGTASPP